MPLPNALSVTLWVEVRTARQASDSNVCRVYDVGEVDGHQFLRLAGLGIWDGWSIE